MTKLLNEMQALLDQETHEGHLFDLLKVHAGVILEVLSKLRDTIASKINTAENNSSPIDEEEIRIEMSDSKNITTV